MVDILKNREFFVHIAIYSSHFCYDNFDISKDFSMKYDNKSIKH